MIEHIVLFGIGTIFGTVITGILIADRYQLGRIDQQLEELDKVKGVEKCTEKRLGCSDG